jgi:hypothetical protein
MVQVHYYIVEYLDLTNMAHHGAFLEEFPRLII